MGERPSSEPIQQPQTRPTAQAPERSEQAGGRPAPRKRPHRRGEGITWPVLLIFFGVMLLFHTTGTLDLSWWRVWMLWPALLILFGLDIWLWWAGPLIRLLAAAGVVLVLVTVGLYLGTVSAGEPTLVACPASEASQGQVELDLPLGRLEVGALESGSVFASASIQGVTVGADPCPVQGETVLLEIPSSGGVATDAWGNLWTVHLTRSLPLKEIEVRMGLGELRLELQDLDVQSVRVEAAVARIEVILPGARTGGTREIRIGTGVGSIEVLVPEGMEAEIRVGAGMRHVSWDGSRFEEREGVYRTRNYGSATRRLQVDIGAGVGWVHLK